MNSREVTMTKKLIILILFAVCMAGALPGRTFGLRGDGFELDGKPFQMIAGEMHFQRIPPPYWKDRLLKAKALGLNTVATYVFWNSLEPLPGQWDFTGSNDVRRFIQLAREIGLLVMLRPGPYACAEWDFGAMPPWLLSIPDIKVRCLDDRYMVAVERYVYRLAEQIRDLQITRGGPIIMMQIENEYGSYGNDRNYLNRLKKLWQRSGIEIPFNTADGATPHMLEAGTVPGAAIGLDPATRDEDFAEAARLNLNVPVFCSELYPGWLTHWGETWASVDTAKVLQEVRWLMDHRKSFNLYPLHGGTNFGWTAGANMGEAYQPDITSYDYDAPLNERGAPTAKYFALRDLLQTYAPRGRKPAKLPAPLPVISIAEIPCRQVASLFDNLPPPVPSVQPRPMEFYNQYSGFVLYRTKLIGRHSGKLVVTEPHDYANVYVDGKYLGTLDRRKNENAIDIPAGGGPVRLLEILVEGMGRINFGEHLIDRKGITDRVTLEGMTLMNWEVYNLPMDAPYLAALKFLPVSGTREPGNFFRGTFALTELGDCFLDMSGWEKGVVWVNGRHLGRYWKIGPQQRLFLPAPFLNKGENVIVVFDLHRKDPAPIQGFPDLK